MKQRLLVSSILLGLSASFAVGHAFAQSSGQTPSDTTDQDKKKETTQLKGITVTGSLIPQAQIETAAPTVTISAADIQKQGFANVYDALRALPLATGGVQDGQFQGGFTQGAHEISILGLDPGFTLTLIDGHPLADYPLLFNGSSNFTDLTNIPVSMVDHIDILPGNNSSIYGSNAIAGVINIVLKQHVDGFNLDYRMGGYTGGGGQQQRLSFTGGYNGSNVNLVYGLQLSNIDPIWGYQRDLTASTLPNPDPTARYGSRTFLIGSYTANGLQYDDPGAATCAQLSNLFNNTTSYQTRPGSGSYCGSQYETGYGTLYSQSHSAAGYFKITDRINDNLELYGTLLANVNNQRYSDGRRFWSLYYIDANAETLNLAQHIFAPEETGGLGQGLIKDLSKTYNFYGGARGNFGSSSWNYDFYYDRSGYKNTTQEAWPLAAPMNSFFESQFLGPKLGTSSGYPIYSPNYKNFYQPLTSTQYASMLGNITSASQTWTQHVNALLTNADLFTLPGGSAGIAAVLQAGNQSWSNPVQDALVNGDFFGRTGTGGAGQRSIAAGAVELKAPILSVLTADASVRYDKYSNDGGGDYSKATYKIGLEFRPVESLLLRGNYGTGFKAPDMSYTFSGTSGYYQAGYTDYYRCASQQPGVPIEQCRYYQDTELFVEHSGNRALKPVTSKSFGVGFVWSPVSNLTVKSDYYKINIANEISIQDLDLLLRNEAACRTGALDPTSPTCVATLAQIQRGAQGNINQVFANTINISKEMVSGILSSLDYKVDAGRYGKFDFNVQYQVTLVHSHQQFPGDPDYNNFTNPYYSNTWEFKTIGNVGVNWDIGPWSTTVYATRYGRTPNNASVLDPAGVNGPNGGYVPPWWIYNATVAYNFSDDVSLSIIGNNLRNSMPPKDNTWTSIPYYNYNLYNVYGRSVFAELSVHFGGGK